MALQKFTRNNDAVSIARPRFGYLACMLFFGLTIINDVAAFSCHRSSPGGSLTSLSTMEQFTRSDTILFGSRDNDDNEDEKDEKQQWQPTNDLDIFGQPKDGSKNRGYEDEGEIRGPDRIKSCIPYILPLIDGDPFGNYVYERIPALGDIHYVLLRPIVEGFQSAPFLTILLFMVFALGPQFASLSREVRFNAQQAVLVDVALILPELISDAVTDADAKIPRTLVEPCSNFVWIALFSVVIYSVASNLRGKKPDQIPWISGTAEYVIGPF
mmetsp:Transcript_12996/g.31659  ORF Transcript_12996/g.31659 Transcript_12996/m.31659 type:complete len:270 (+) Transcript_12996:180-989(+)